MRTATRFLIFAIPVITVGGLFLSSVLTMRDRQAQTQCLNNLRQLALSVQSHHDNLRILPSDMGSFCPAPKLQVPWEKQMSWLFMIAPFIEARMDKKWSNASQFPWGSEGNERFFREETWVAFTCPAQSRQKDDQGFYLTHYVGISGVGKDAHLVPMFPEAGIFGVGRLLRFDDIKDGAENTILILETGTDNGPWGQNGYPTVRGLDPNGLPYLGATAQFSSLHNPGGFSRGGLVQGALCDSSARAFRASISPWILEALATIAGSEELPSDLQW